MILLSVFMSELTLKQRNEKLYKYNSKKLFSNDKEGCTQYLKEKYSDAYKNVLYDEESNVIHSDTIKIQLN